MSTSPEKASSTAEEIVSEIKNFFGDRNEGFLENVKNALNIIEGKGEHEAQVIAVGNALQQFWTKYSTKNIATVLEEFPKVEKVLYGLERRKEEGGRYRDHFLHMFHNFIFGIRIFAQIASNHQDSIDTLFKVVPEPKELKAFFAEPYKPQERLFFLWALISTFEDIGVPLEHIEYIKRGLNSFLQHFGLTIRNLELDKALEISTKIDRYFKLMAGMFHDGILHESKGTYHQTGEFDNYLYNALATRLDKLNHAVFAALLLFRSIEEAFLKGKNEQYPNLTRDDCDKYVKLVFEHDITRAALAVAMHDMKPDESPKLFPISITKFPLTFMIILADDIQEYLRPEERTEMRETLQKHFPYVAVKVEDDRLHVKIFILYDEPSTDEDKKAFEKYLESFNARARAENEREAKNFNDHINIVWHDKIVPNLRRKLTLGSSEPIRIQLSVYVKKDGEQYNAINWDSG